MNEVMQCILRRRSTKSYTDQQIPDALLDQVLQAAIYAPTGRNNQNVICVAVRDQETRDQLSRMNAEIWGTETDPFYGAPCVIVVLTDPSGNTPVEDGSVVLGHMLIAAESLGLGACWIHRARQMFESDEGKALLKKWGLPETMIGIGNCILGYAAQEPVAKPRKEGRIIKIG